MPGILVLRRGIQENWYLIYSLGCIVYWRTVWGIQDSITENEKHTKQKCNCKKSLQFLKVIVLSHMYIRILTKVLMCLLPVCDRHTASSLKFVNYPVIWSVSSSQISYEATSSMSTWGFCFLDVFVVFWCCRSNSCPEFYFSSKVQAVLLYFPCFVKPPTALIMSDC